MGTKPIKREKIKYEYFQKPEAKENIIQIGNNLADHLFQNNINNIIFIDRAARAGYVALKKAWKNKFPDSPTPNIYFTNPDGYRPMKQNSQHPIPTRTHQNIVNDFNSTYKKLSSDKNQKIMLFDICMHSGDTAESILNILNQAGYPNITLGLTQPRDNNYPFSCQVDFEAINHNTLYPCLPFDKEPIIDKNSYSVVSTTYSNPTLRKMSLKKRKEIASLFETNSNSLTSIVDSLE